MGALFLLAAAVCSWLGAMTVIWRREMKVVLDEYAVRIVDSNREDTIHYTDIKNVRLGADNEVVIERIDPPSDYRFWTGNFASDEELNVFITELKQRVEDAKRPPESPPVSS